MNISINLSDFKHKAHKAQEILSFYMSRYMGRDKAPVPNESFFSNLQCDTSVIKKVLFQNIDENKVMEAADRICYGELRLYNLDPAVFETEINWHKDYYSGYEWPLKPFNMIYSVDGGKRDLNVPLELSRMQCIPTLIQAFEITSDLKYINRLTDLVDSWIDKNPYCFGVNWWTGMEVALRAVNLMLAIGLIGNSITTQKRKTYLTVLWKHALYIYKYDVVRHRVKIKNNHFLASMMGLLALSFCLEGSEAMEMRSHALTALKKEIVNQFIGDGGNFESSTGYHQFSLEVVLVSILLLRVYYNNNASKDFVDASLGTGTCESMLKALGLVCDYMSCYGESPHIGDSSDCRVFVFKDYFDRAASDHSFLLELGKYAVNYHPPARTDCIVKHYLESGYAFFSNNSYGLIAFAGPKGTNGSGGHGHNDKCSFVMQVDGGPVFVDSGTYIYNSHPFERYEFKKSQAHNIVSIDSEEQCLINAERVFGLIGQINPQIKIKECDEVVEIRMEHDGYRRLNGLGLVLRKIVCGARSIEIRDGVDGSGLHEVSMFFNFHPSVTCQIVNNTLRIESRGTNIMIVFQKYFQVRLEKSHYSDSYHAKMRNARIVANAELELPFSWKTRIEML